MNGPGEYYRLSGAVTPGGILMAMFYGGPTAWIFGTLYGYWGVSYPGHRPLVFFAAGLGFLVGAAAGLGAKNGGLRNVLAVVALGFLSALVALYANWVGWIWAVSDGAIITFDPRLMSAVVGQAALHDPWFSRSWSPPWTILYLLWFVEALVVVCAAVGGAWFIIARAPFCERCRAWLGKPSTIGPFQPVGNIKLLRSALEKGDGRILEELGSGMANDAHHTDLELRQCPKCRQFHLLTIKDCQPTGRGDYDTMGVTVIKNLIIDAEFYSRLLQKSMNTRESAGANEGEARPDSEPREKETGQGQPKGGILPHRLIIPIGARRRN